MTTTTIIEQLPPEVVEDERRLARGTLAAQYRTHVAQNGSSRRYGPYISLVLRVASDEQAWFYLGKFGTSRYHAKLSRAREIISMNSHLTNAEIAKILKEVMK